MATYGQKSKILLLVNSLPWGNGTGELFLRSLAEQFHQNELCLYLTVQQDAPLQSSNTGEIIIGFAESMYAKNESRTLFKSIESIKGLLRGKSIKIKFVGKWPKLGMPQTEISALGLSSWALPESGGTR